LLILLSFPIALIFGIIGIVQDQHKLVAAAAALIAGICVLFFLVARIGL